MNLLAGYRGDGEDVGLRWTRDPELEIELMPEKSEFEKQIETAVGDSQYHPSVKAIIRFFEWEHLPKHLQEVSKPFGALAKTIADRPNNPETTVAMRKLLEAKDAAVRAVLFKEPVTTTHGIWHGIA